MKSSSPCCKHAAESRYNNRVICNLGLYGGTPHLQICQQCPQRIPLDYPAGNELGGRELPHASVGTAISRVVDPGLSGNAEAALLTELERKASICESCSHCKGVTRQKGRFSVYTVRCGLCGCGGLSLRNGKCAAGKWSNSNSNQPPSETAYKGKTKLLLRCTLSPGDVVTLTAAVRDLHRAHRGKYATAVATTAQDLWKHNPYVSEFTPGDKDVREIRMQYPLVNQSNQRPYHFIHGYVQYLEEQLRIRIPLTEFRGDIHLAAVEKSSPPQVFDQFGFKGPYWVIVAGGKTDFTAKWWAPEYYQQVVDHFQGRVQFVQCGEGHHRHSRLKGVFDLVGKTDIRQFIQLMYHAHGVVCPVTFAMHLAAAVPPKMDRLRACVVVAGGREPPHWEAYPGHQFLHTVGALPCCSKGGCWRSRCQTVGDGDSKDRQNLCERPVQIQPDLRIPQCMAMIRPADVIREIDKYLTA